MWYVTMHGTPNARFGTAASSWRSIHTDNKVIRFAAPEKNDITFYYIYWKVRVKDNTKMKLDNMYMKSKRKPLFQWML